MLDVGINNVDDATKKRGGRTPPRQECRRVRQPIGVIATCLTEDQLRPMFSLSMVCTQLTEVRADVTKVRT